MRHASVPPVQNPLVPAISIPLRNALNAMTKRLERSANETWCARLGEFVAGSPSSEFLIRNVALMTVRKSEIVLARLGEAIEFVLGYVLRQPVVAILSEVELP